MIGIVTALRVEARCVTPLRLPFNQMIGLGESAAIWLCGMGEEAAREAAEGLMAGGATSLMSLGLAGALDSRLRPGDLVLPESIYAGRPRHLVARALSGPAYPSARITARPLECRGRYVGCQQAGIDIGKCKK